VVAQEYDRLDDPDSILPLQCKLAYDLMVHGRYEAAATVARKQLRRVDELEPNCHDNIEMLTRVRDYLKLVAGVAAAHLDDSAAAIPLLDSVVGLASSDDRLDDPAPVPNLRGGEIRFLANAALDEAFTRIGQAKRAQAHFSSALDYSREPSWTRNSTKSLAAPAPTGLSPAPVTKPTSTPRTPTS